MKIVFIHDWFTISGGAEKVAKAILEVIGDVEVYCLFDFFNKKDRDEILKGKKTKTSFLQNFPQSKKHYRNYLPLYSMAIESFNLSNYDLIISSSSAVAKSVKVKNGQIHISYCHSPMRYIWDMKNQYIEDINPLLKRKIVEKVFESLPEWDKKTSKTVTHFIANSNFIAKRIKKSYNRNSSIIYPPVNTSFFTPGIEKKENYFIVISRLVSYKKIQLIAEAFESLPNENLIVIGQGPDLKKLPKLKNVKYLGHLNNIEMRGYLRKAKAMILAAIEDFGISALEAQSCGIPIIALKEGGYLETIVENKTGLFFEEQTPKSITQAVKQFKLIENSFSSDEIRKHALKFDEEIFKTKFKAEINKVLTKNESPYIFK